MAIRRKRKLLVTKTAELAFAVPLVVAHRITRMAIAGFSPTERDWKEFQRMGTEKTTAFIESWNAMAMQGIRANQALAASFVHAFWAPWLGGKLSARTATTRMHNAALGVLGKGMGACASTSSGERQAFGSDQASIAVWPSIWKSPVAARRFN